MSNTLGVMSWFSACLKSSSSFNRKDVLPHRRPPITANDFPFDKPLSIRLLASVYPTKRFPGREQLYGLFPRVIRMSLLPTNSEIAAHGFRKYRFRFV